MALWGNKDSIGLTGTVAVTNASAAVVGTGTLFTTELKAGNTLVVAGVEYKITAIASNTALTVSPVYAGSTDTGLIVTANDQPVYVSNGELSKTFGVSVDEAKVASNKAKGLNTPGWVKYTTYTNAQGATRHKSEVLVAMGSIISDAADDAVLADS